MIRVVIDTKIFVSTLLFENSLPFQVVKLAESKGVILFSKATLGELKQVLNRKNFDKYITLQEREAFFLKLMMAGENVVIHHCSVKPPSPQLWGSNICKSPPGLAGLFHCRLRQQGRWEQEPEDIFCFNTPDFDQICS